MFVEITTNTNTKALVRTDDIVGIKELPLETEKLYDEEGNVVSETPKDKAFQVFVKNNGSALKLMVNETEYQKLVAELTK